MALADIESNPHHDEPGQSPRAERSQFVENRSSQSTNIQRSG
jgi:hypothetical protein